MIAVVQHLGVVAIGLAVWANVRQFRRWKRETVRAHDAARVSGQVTAALLIRGRAWWECDRCGGRLDTGAGPDHPVCVEVVPGGVVLLCPACSPTPHDDDVRVTP